MPIKYILYNEFGKAYFIIEYDKYGVRQYNGPTIKSILNTKDNGTNEKILHVGDTLRYKYLLANIPLTKRKFKIENVKSRVFHINRVIKFVPPTQVNIDEILTKKGQNTIRAIVAYEFLDKITPAIIDTLTFNVNVEG